MATMCATHAASRAGWICLKCGPRCPACVGERMAGFNRIDVCATCGAMATAIRERRALIEPFLSELPWALLWPFSRSGLLMVFAWALFLSLATLIRAGGFARGILLAYLFHVARWTALGNDDVPGAGDFRGFFEDIVAPLSRLVLATVWVTAPLVFLVWGMDEPAHPAVIAAVLLVGLALVPISLLASSVGTPFSIIINPLMLIRYALKLGADYLALLGFCAVSVGLYAAVTIGAAALLADNVLVRFLVNAVLLVFPFAFFRAVGLMLRARGDDLGWGRAEDYLINVLGDVKPQAGTIENVQGRAISTRAAEAKAQERAVASAGGHHLGVDHEAPLPQRAAPEPIALDDLPAGEAPATELLRHVRGDDPAAALELLDRAQREIPALTLSAEGWLNLGRAGVQQKRVKPALVALRRAIDVAPAGPLAPQAWLMAARLYDEALGDRAQSDRLLGELVKRFPDSQEGRFAAKRLGARNTG